MTTKCCENVQCFISKASCCNPFKGLLPQTESFEAITGSQKSIWYALMHNQYHKLNTCKESHESKIIHHLYPWRSFSLKCPVKLPDLNPVVWMTLQLTLLFSLWFTQFFTCGIFNMLFWFTTIFFLCIVTVIVLHVNEPSFQYLSWKTSELVYSTDGRPVLFQFLRQLQDRTSKQWLRCFAVCFPVKQMG